ncbi:glucose dehydrogenase [Pseudomonas sp. F-14 TE3623]
MNQRTLARGAGVSNLLFGVYTIFVALLGLALAYRGGVLVTAGGSPYYAMMGTALLLSAILIGLKQSLGIYLYGTTSLATYAWAIWESGYDGWDFIPRLAWLAVLSVLFLAFWPLVRRDFANARRSHYFTIMGLLPILMGGTILVSLFFPTTVHLADSTCATTRPEQNIVGLVARTTLA